MIYSYYCVDCGRKFPGEQICFDLAELLGLRTEAGSNPAVKSKLTQIDAGRLKKMIRQAGVNEIVHGSQYEVKITLKEFLGIIGENFGQERGREELLKYEYTELHEAIEQVYDGLANVLVRQAEIDDYVSALHARFVYTGKIDEDREDTENYRAAFWVKPEFFEEGNSDEIYTVRYSFDKNPVNMYKIGLGGQIRGYCPVCGRPVIMEAGRYRHTLIGLLGAQSAGKTSTIVAMLEELKTNYKRFGIKFPGNPLWDSRSADREVNMTLYSNGWAVKKTAVDTGVGAFNASLLLESADEGRNDEGRKQILTFVDIAGEQCYNLQTKEMNRNALDVYPLINSCHIYLLCSSIDLRGYGNAVGEETFIPPEAVIQIAKGIYEELREPQNIPPICIVATKADMAADAFSRPASQNPFDGIQPGGFYAYQRELDTMKGIYATATDENIRNPLEMCCAAYDELKKVTYVSMLSCSALGHKGMVYEGDIQNIGPYKNPDTGMSCPFERARIEVLWNWILQTVGLSMTDGYALPYIPSYGEGYRMDSQDESTKRVHRRVYSLEEAQDRISAAKRLFINSSQDDVELEDAFQFEPNFFERIRGMSSMSEVRRVAERID